MKKVFLAIAVASVFTACNNGGETTETKTDSSAVKVDTTKKCNRYNCCKNDRFSSQNDTAAYN
jgi:hypothetical protein